MINVKEAIDAVTELLIDFGKSDPDRSDRVEVVRDQISKIVLSAVMSPDDATENYGRICEDFLDKVIRVKGIPTRAIGGGGDIPSELVSSSGRHIAERFNVLLPKIKERYRWCIENYQIQSKNYFDEQFGQLSALISSFLNEVPATAKARAAKISPIKKEIRCLAKWNRLFYIYKALSFSAEIHYIFALESGPLAAIWRYTESDEQGEYTVTHNHKDRDRRVYAVRGNWAVEKGLMSVGLDGYIDDIDRPGQEVGCMCNLVWVSAIRDLPRSMLTERGQSELKRTRVTDRTAIKSG
ncbi:MAG: hypothetical protein ACYDBH_22775 [Acidobacteriaceae bacterium]